MLSGNQVISTNAAGAASARDTILGALAGGVSRLVDLEISSREQVLADRADATRAPRVTTTTGFGDVVANITPAQWAMLGVAGLLGVGLVAGWFR